MKLKINKACDLNSISVLPPHTRRSNIMQQPRSQPSQQSFSQGISSHQNGTFSQLSQSSFDEALTDNQKFSSQEKDNSAKRLSCLAPVSYTREENQMPISRSSSSLTRKWSSAGVSEHKCQLSDEVEHKISMMETSLTRLGMIIDSIQADVMQANKGTKELSLEAEGIRQKLISHHDSLQQLIRSQEDTRASFESISNQLQDVMVKDKTQETLLAVLDLREQIETNLQKENEKLSKFFSGKLQAISYGLKTLHQENMPLSMLPPKVTGAESSSQKPLIMREPMPSKLLKQANHLPKVETGCWTIVKGEKTATNRYENSCKNLIQQRASADKEQKVVIDLDDEADDDDFSCFIAEKESGFFGATSSPYSVYQKLSRAFFPTSAGKHFVHELEEDTAQILRKARRRKRKQDCKSLCVNPRK